MTTSGSFGVPMAPAFNRAASWNGRVTTVTVGIPFFSSQAASWILHDVQPPQSPHATTTAETDGSSSWAIAMFGVRYFRTV